MTRRIGIDITPDKTLTQKVGLVGYSTTEAVAELLDNSIDARIEGMQEDVHVTLDYEGKRIVIRDNGRGMDKEDLKNAMTLARGTKGDGSLGMFGIGLKSSCSYLGRSFEIRTSKLGTGKEYVAAYDEEKWLTDKSLDWGNFEIVEKALGGGEDQHGTTITISDLNVPLYPNQVTAFKRNFGARYGPFLEDGQVSITVNTTSCRPVRPDVVDGSRREIDVEVSPGVRVRGHLELLEKRSIGGKYGIDLYRHNRLIKPFVKFGFPAHPETARVIGKINLDHVPVNFQKNDFLTESREYVQALAGFKACPELREVLAAAKSRGGSGATVRSVFKSFMSGSSVEGLRHAMRAEQAREVLKTTKPFEVRSGRATTRIEVKSVKGGPLYVVGGTPGNRTVTINRESASFAFVRNPLFLVGMIAAEVGAMQARDAGKFVAARNEFLEKSLRSSEDKKKAKPRRREVPIPDIPGYWLAGELVDMHDHLKENFPRKFQFTAMSTLTPYLHNLKGKIAYTVHTAPNHAEYLKGILDQRFGEAIPVLEMPDRKTIRAFFATPGVDRVIAVREFEVIPGSTIAGPEKAVMDLATESRTYGIPVDALEVRRIFHTMSRLGLVDLEKARKYARSIKRMRMFEEMAA